MLHEYHVIYSVLYYPRFHVTVVGLGTYYQRIRGRYCIFKGDTGLKQNIIILRILEVIFCCWAGTYGIPTSVTPQITFSFMLEWRQPVSSVFNLQYKIQAVEYIRSITTKNGGYVLNETECCMSGEWEWLKTEGLCVWGNYKSSFIVLCGKLLVLSCCSVHVTLLKILNGTLSVGILLLSSRPTRVGINRWNPVCSSVSQW
jgi:hypothetical protein